MAWGRRAPAGPPEAEAERWRRPAARAALRLDLNTARLHLAPLHDVPLRALAPSVVREWHASALRGRGGRVSIQQSYRFLRAVMNTAVRDGAIEKNPCQITGAGTDRAKERPWRRCPGRGHHPEVPGRRAPGCVVRTA